MATRKSCLFIGLVVVIVIVLHASAASGVVLKDKNLCNVLKNCYHNQSGLCGSNSIFSCNQQLNNAENEDGDCQLARIDPLECYIEEPSYLSSPDEIPINLQMYYYTTWMISRATPNITFPMPTWENVKFRYQGRENKTLVLCRKLSLANVSVPLATVLMWDCPIFDVDDYSGHSFDLSIITSEGKGGKYAFKVPEEQRFDHRTTKLQNWHVFFFVHLDHIHRSVNLPVTIQLAPFKNLSYNVAINKCLNDDDRCDLRTTLASFIVENPEINATTVGFTKQMTKLLPSWSSPATYAVTVQIVSPECPIEGCFVSVSPTFEIEESQFIIWLCVAFGFILIFVFAFFITLHHRTKENRKLLMALKDKPPTVLLLYLPENHHCLELVKAFATFLKDTCYIHPYVIDTDVGSQNPNSWTSEHMNKANRMVFIVPGNPNGESVTPIRDQWLYALQYLSGHYFTTHHAAKKVATVLFPFSADVPNEIAHVQRFRLVKEMTHLVTWIHDGSWVDGNLVWGPQIRSSLRNVNSHSIAELAQLVDQASQVTKCHKGVRQILVKENDIFKSVLTNGVESCPPTAQLMTNSDPRKTFDSQDLNDTIVTCESEEDPFDPNIPDVDELLINAKETQKVDESDEYSDEYSDLDDSHFI